MLEAWLHWYSVDIKISLFHNNVFTNYIAMLKFVNIITINKTLKLKDNLVKLLES